MTGRNTRNSAPLALQHPMPDIRKSPQHQPSIQPDTPIGTLADYWLETRCCGGTAFFPFKLVATRLRHGNRTLLRDALRRFRCKACGGAPQYVAVIERADGNTAFGPGLGWRIAIDAQTGAPLETSD
jgi:hypothetical protein